jgi:hypothetical protein
LNNVSESQFASILSIKDVIPHIQRYTTSTRSEPTLSANIDALYNQLIPKDGLRGILPCVSILHDFLGYNYSFFPIKNAAHFEG